MLLERPSCDFPAEEVDDNGEDLPLDVCFVLRDGSDVTLVTWGAMILETMDAAERLATAGIETEVIDLATLKPIDVECVLSSVRRTGRCVVIHEAPLSGGLGGEVAARIADEALTALLAPIKRITGYDTIMPLPRLEEHYMPSVERIIEAARKVMEYA